MNFRFAVKKEGAKKCIVINFSTFSSVWKLTILTQTTCVYFLDNEVTLSLWLYTYIQAIEFPQVR